MRALTPYWLIDFLEKITLTERIQKTDGNSISMLRTRRILTRVNGIFYTYRPKTKTN